MPRARACAQRRSARAPHHVARRPHRRPLEGTPESEASAQEPASRPRPRRSRRLPAPCPHGVRLRRQHRRRCSATAAGNIKCDGKGSCWPPAPPRRRTPWTPGSRTTRQACTGRQINYKATGSGAGIQAFIAGPDRLRRLRLGAQAGGGQPQSKKICTGGQGINLPMVGGPIAVGYNVPGVDNLSWTPPTLAKIFDRQDHQVERPGDREAEPRTPSCPATKIQAVPPLGRVGHHRQLHQVPDRRRRRRLDRTRAARPGRPRAARPRQGSSGVAGRSSRPTARSATWSCPTPTGRPQDGRDRHRRRRARRGHRRERLQGHRRRQGRGHRQRPRAGARLHHQGRGRLPDRPRDVRDRLRQGQQGRHPDRRPSPSSTYTASEDGQALLAELGYAPLPDEIVTKVRTTIVGA